MFPSTVKETNLSVILICNEENYQLFTIRVKHINRYSPQFYGDLPYTVNVSEVSSKKLIEKKYNICYIFYYLICTFLIHY